MNKLNTEAIFSPLGIFIIYTLASALVIIGFRFIFPGAPVPLPYFSVSWRFIRGFLDFLGLFPALILSALVIPFGFKKQVQEKINPFSPLFLQSLRMSIITAIAAAAFYGLLVTLALPMAQDYEANLVIQSRLYALAKDKAMEHAALDEWEETAQFIGICEQIWPNGPDLAKLKTETEIRIEGRRVARGTAPVSGAVAASTSDPGARQPVDATEALIMAETAIAEERYFDAHWLATLGGRLAGTGSPESSLANRIAGMAWSGINSMAPNDRESKVYTVYRLKREGYEALLGEEWIRSYYIFRELLGLTPQDPDAEKYLAISEAGLKQLAFFIDEIDLKPGRTTTGAVFSLPLDSGRLVMKISSLSVFPDSAYGIGMEILAFDRDGLPLWSIDTPYAKMLPMTLDSDPGVVVLLRALDRADKTRYWEPEIQGYGQNIPGATETVLQVSWDNFLLLSDVRRGLTGLSPADLRRAADNLGTYGYQSQVFEAELLRRFSGPLLLLPLGIFAIVIGWRYRALKRPRYMGIPMLGILPLVFNGAVYFCRGWINNLGIWAVVSFGFTTAAVFLGIGVLILFIISLISLAAQHG